VKRLPLRLKLRHPEGRLLIQASDFHGSRQSAENAFLTAHRNDGKEAEHHPKEVPRRTGIRYFARNEKRGTRKAAGNGKNDKSLPFLDWEGYHSLYAELGYFIVVSQYPERSLLAINQKPPDIHVDTY
jgi:hypothetical protein